MVKVGDMVICVSDAGAPGRFTKGKLYEVVQVVERRRPDEIVYRCVDDRGGVTGQFARRWQTLENGPW